MSNVLLYKNLVQIRNKINKTYQYLFENSAKIPEYEIEVTVPFILSISLDKNSSATINGIEIITDIKIRLIKNRIIFNTIDKNQFNEGLILFLTLFLIINFLLAIITIAFLFKLNSSLIDSKFNAILFKKIFTLQYPLNEMLPNKKSDEVSSLEVERFGKTNNKQVHTHRPNGREHHTYCFCC